jgi:hypothetical protein
VSTLDVADGVADRDGVPRGPVACAFARSVDQLSALLAVAAESAVSGLEEVREPEPLHAGARHRFGVAGEEREHDSACLEARERSLRIRRGLPAVGARARDSLDIAGSELGAPGLQAFVDPLVGETGVAEQ